MLMKSIRSIKNRKVAENPKYRIMIEYRSVKEVSLSQTALPGKRMNCILLMKTDRLRLPIRR